MDHSPKIDFRLDAEARADRVTKEVLRGLFATLEANLGGVRGNLDAEFLHDLRVAVRRIRCALGQVRGVLDSLGGFPDRTIPASVARGRPGPTRPDAQPRRTGWVSLRSTHPTAKQRLRRSGGSFLRFGRGDDDYDNDYDYDYDYDNDYDNDNDNDNDRDGEGTA